MSRIDPLCAGETERVALVALLGEAAGEPRRRYTAWSAIASALVRLGSAIAL